MVRFSDNKPIIHLNREQLKNFLLKKSAKVKGRKSFIHLISFANNKTKYCPVPCIRTNNQVWVTKKTIKYILNNFGSVFKS